MEGKNERLIKNFKSHGHSPIQIFEGFSSYQGVDNFSSF